MKPAADPKADELRNSNMPQPLDVPLVEEVATEEDRTGGVNDAFDSVDQSLDAIFKDLEVELDGP
jgi:hypothetical protein